MKLIVDPTITPVAKHVPAPVPWHFREKVKAGLEADCRMRVLSGRDVKVKDDDSI